jgi:hypothetical protein
MLHILPNKTQNMFVLYATTHHKQIKFYLFMQLENKKNCIIVNVQRD